MREEIILVDQDDNVVGKGEKLAVHQHGLLHRAFSIFIFNKKNELLLQKRAIEKYHSGGLWTNACCSHPRVGEDTVDAAHRRLLEEMGFDCDIKEYFAFTYKQDVGNGLIENEYDHVFVGRYDGQVSPNSQEVSDYKWIAQGDLLKDVQVNPYVYTCWFKKVIERVLF